MKKNVYVEIDNQIIGRNVKTILEKYADYQYYIGVIKGNCYGHGIGVIKPMEENGINYFAVSTLEEAIQARTQTNLPILCLQPIAIEDLSLAHEKRITITVSSLEYFKQIEKLDFELKIHLKLNTGMNRLGLDNKEEVKEIYGKIEKHKYLSLEGIYTHLQTIGVVDDKWDKQIERFKQLTSLIPLDKIKIVHIYSSNSVVIHPKLPFCNGCRLGIIMYGISPRPISYQGLVGKLKKIKHNSIRKSKQISIINESYGVDVKPAFELVSNVVEIKSVPKGEYIGYGLKYQVEKDTRIAVVEIGYADGLPLSHTGSYVSIQEKRYKIVGSINMKMVTVEVDDTVKIGDRVNFIHGNVREIVAHDSLTPHYLFTSIPENIERRYKNGR